MPIIVRHDVAGGLIGAYASGQGSARQRAQKYALNNLLLQQRHQQRLREIAAMRGGRGRAAAPMVQFQDPLQVPDASGAIDPIQQRAARRARARKYRLGRGIPQQWQPTPIPLADLERQQEMQDKMTMMELQDSLIRQRAAESQEAIAQRATQSQQAAAERARMTQDAIAERGVQSQEDRAYAEALNDIETGRRVLDPTVRNRIDAAQQEILTDDSLDDEQREEALGNFQVWRRRQIMGGIRFPETTVEDRKVAKEEAEQELAQRKEVESKLESLKKERRALRGQDRPPSQEVLSELNEDIARLEAQLEPTATAIVPPPAPAGSVASPTPAPVAPAEPPTPTGEQPVETAPAPQASSLDLANLSPQQFTHPDMQPVQRISGEEFDQLWKLMEPGQSIRGPDGRMYTKRR